MFEIQATCYRTENAQIPKSAGESAGKSAGEKGTAGTTAGSSAVSLLFQRDRPPSTAAGFFGKAEKRHCFQQSSQQSPFPRHSSQHSPQHFWGFGRSQSCSRSLGFQTYHVPCNQEVGMLSDRSQESRGPPGPRNRAKEVSRRHKDPEFYSPLALTCQKGQHFPAPEVCIKLSLPSFFQRNPPAPKK